MRAIIVTGSDTQMDSTDVFRPLNKLPEACSCCHFPDIDFVPAPYFLIRSRTRDQNELAPAVYGNLLVKQRMRVVLETVAPGQCSFHPTSFLGTDERTPWLLAVPVKYGTTGEVKAGIPRCPKCGRPASAHPGTQYMTRTIVSDFDVAKASNWASSESGWDRWISRDLLFSVRLVRLIKAAKGKGLTEQTCTGETKPESDEKMWIEEKLAVLYRNGVSLEPEGLPLADDIRWFRHYKKANARTQASATFSAIERKGKFKLPPSYKEFIKGVGPRRFDDVDRIKGFTVHVLPPSDLDVERYRRGMIKAGDDESDGVDGIMFARTGHGDCFCFDLRGGSAECPVYLYLHEGDYFEPYARGFIECLRRFSGE